MALTWAQRREELLSDCMVSPDVFTPMIDRLAEFAVPYQQAMETETAQRNMHLYLQGLLSHLPSKNAENIATFVDVQRQVIQEFILQRRKPRPLGVVRDKRLCLTKVFGLKHWAAVWARMAQVQIEAECAVIAAKLKHGRVL